MATLYTEIPHNFDEIRSYVICDRTQIIHELQSQSRYYLYDSCTFQKHAQLPHPEWLFAFFKKTEAIMVLTGCILMELGHLSGILEHTYIDYIKQLHAAHIKVLILYEEDIFRLLDQVFSSNARINEFLSLAVKTVKTSTGTVQSTLNEYPSLKNDLLGANKITSHQLFEQFFVAVRKNKEQGDNLGEEILAICVHLLANIPDDFDHKYVVLTEDKGAIGLINKAKKNSEQYAQSKKISVFTTPKLAQRMYQDGIITDKTQIEEVLSTALPDSMLKIRGSEEYDIEDRFLTISYGELAEKITIPGGIHIQF